MSGCWIFWIYLFCLRTQFKKAQKFTVMVHGDSISDILYGARRALWGSFAWLMWSRRVELARKNERIIELAVRIVKRQEWSQVTRPLQQDFSSQKWRRSLASSCNIEFQTHETTAADILPCDSNAPIQLKWALFSCDYSGTRFHSSLPSPPFQNLWIGCKL